MAGALALAKPVSVLGWLRITLRLLAMLLLLLACVTLYYVWRLFGPHNPWPSFFLAGIGRIAGVRLRTTGQPARQGQGLELGGAFVLANHVSWIDIPALAASCGAVFVAHDGIASVPLLHWLCRMNETVFVARHDRNSVAAQVAQVRGAIREG
jgi:1-acyl-sn-glycerol-3-phosphate acyltransferase